MDILHPGLQVAALLAMGHPDDEELQVSRLVHDIGHCLVPADETGHRGHAAGWQTVGLAVAPLQGPRGAVGDLLRRPGHGHETAAGVREFGGDQVAVSKSIPCRIVQQSITF